LLTSRFSLRKDNIKQNIYLKKNFLSIFITVAYELIFRISILFIAVGSVGEPPWGAEALQQAGALPVAWPFIFLFNEMYKNQKPQDLLGSLLKNHISVTTGY
jgi:hypothetical protein